MTRIAADRRSPAILQPPARLPGRDRAREYHAALCHALRHALPLLLMLLLVAGCSEPSSGLNTAYGSRRSDGRSSVNGTSILASMFARAGYEVTSWRRLSPRLQYEEVIVWTPDTFSVPSDDEIRYLETWLAAGDGRTLIYIGRDYDAAIDYWQEVLASNPPDPIAVRRELARATSKHAERRDLLDRENLKCDWFRWDVDQPPLVLRSPNGPWAEAIQAEQAANTANAESSNDAIAGTSTSFQARLRWRLLEPETPAGEADWRGPLNVDNFLLADGQPLAVRFQRPAWGDGQLIVIPNGSWLLNLPLVREGNRQLAGQLIRECGGATRVCFLESNQSGLPITESDAQVPLMLQSFTVWPINLLVLHLLLLGLVYCFSIYPIFGAPRPMAEDRVSDFGKHIDAVGALIERNRDAAFAERQVRTYRDTTGQSGGRDPGST